MSVILRSAINLSQWLIIIKLTNCISNSSSYYNVWFLRCLLTLFFAFRNFVWPLLVPWWFETNTNLIVGHLFIKYYHVFHFFHVYTPPTRMKRKYNAMYLYLFLLFLFFNLFPGIAGEVYINVHYVLVFFLFHFWFQSLK